MLQDTLPLSEARRAALAAQSFDRSRPRGPVTLQHLRRTIRQLGLVQIDYVNVLVPAARRPISIGTPRCPAGSKLQAYFHRSTR